MIYSVDVNFDGSKIIGGTKNGYIEIFDANNYDMIQYCIGIS